MKLEQMFETMEEKSGMKSDFYKLKEGSNKLRILSEFEMIGTVMNGRTYKGLFYEGKKLDDGDKVGYKGWAWAIDRTTGELVIAQLGKTILGQIVELKKDSQYLFEDFPMPYDIDVKAKNAGTTDVEYTVVPARQNTEVTEEEMAMLNKEKTIPTIVQTILDKQQGKTPNKATEIEYPKEEINPNDVAF